MPADDMDWDYVADLDALAQKSASSRRCSEKVNLDPGVPKKGCPKEGCRTRGAERNNLRERGADPGVPREILGVANPGSRGAKKGMLKKNTLEELFSQLQFTQQ